jgi:hypothetical protein
MHKIKVWRKKSITKRFGNSPRLRPRTKIIQQNNLFTLKKKKSNQSVLFFRVKRRITLKEMSQKNLRTFLFKNFDIYLTAVKFIRVVKTIIGTIATVVYRHAAAVSTLELICARAVSG